MGAFLDEICASMQNLVTNFHIHPKLLLVRIKLILMLV